MDRIWTSQSTRGSVDGVPASAEPWMLMSGVVVADQAQVEMRRHGLIEQTQKPEPLLVAMPFLTKPVDLAIGRIERSKQGGGAIAFVVWVRVWLRPRFSVRPGCVRSKA
jgi:hypothetical protein